MILAEIGIFTLLSSAYVLSVYAIGCGICKVISKMRQRAKDNQQIES